MIRQNKSHGDVERLMCTRLTANPVQSRRSSGLGFPCGRRPVSDLQDGRRRPVWQVLETAAGWISLLEVDLHRTQLWAEAR